MTDTATEALPRIVRPTPDAAWGSVVNGWNKLPPAERRRRRDICLQIGHDYHFTNIGSRMCYRCCAWMED